jgi:sulfate permease, SulP family
MRLSSPGARAPTARWADAIAAISIAGLLLPEAVAYSALAGLPPQAGVMALFAGLVCYAALGSSRYAIVSATSSSAAVLAAATMTIAEPSQRMAFAALLVIAAGVAFILAGSARLGAVSNLIARPVLRGYIFGLALVIVLQQWPSLVGIHAHGSNVLPLLVAVLHQPRAWNLTSLAAGAIALALLLLLQRLRYFPGALIVIIGGIAVAPWLSTHGVALTGPIHLAPAALQFALPEERQWLPLIEYAIALMFILYAESWSSVRSFALKHDDQVQANRELLALGLANVVAGLLHGTPVGAGYSGTAANEAAGAQSRWAGVGAAAVLLLVVLVFLRWIERVPQAVLAAIVIQSVSKSLRVAPLRPYFRWRRDRAVTVIAFCGVLVFGVINGLLAAIAFSLIILLRSLASPHLSILGRLGVHDFVSRERYPHAALIPGMLIVRPEEPLFFANAEPVMALVRAAVRTQADAKVLVLSLEESPDLDGTSIESLSELADWLAARGIELRIARLKAAAHDVLAAGDLLHLPPSALEYASVDDAVSGTGAVTGAVQA